MKPEKVNKKVANMKNKFNKEQESNQANIKINSNSGFSLMSLIITIILIILLASIAIINGFGKNIDEAEYTKMLNEFIEVENAIAQRGMEHKLDANVYPYESKVAYSNESKITIDNTTYGEGYHLVTPVELEKLGVTGATRDFVVNYITGDVILKEPLFLNDKEIYTKDDMLNENDLVTEGEYDEKKGVNKPMLLNGMLPVKYDGSNWVIVSTTDEEWYDYSIDESGGPLRYANVMLMDDTTVRDTSGRILTNEQIRGTNIENLVGMKIDIEGSMFIWIPRFTYKIEGDGSKSIVYSNLTKDYTLNGYIKSPAFYQGEYAGAESTGKDNTGYVAGGKELTGIWISKYEAGYLN